MKKFEALAKAGTPDYPEEYEEDAIEANGKVLDLLLPLLSLVIMSVSSILYTGGFFHGDSLSESLAKSDPIMGLALGAIFTVFFQLLLYIPRKIITPQQFSESIIEGTKMMLPADLILILAWGLSGITGADYLNVGGFISNVIATHQISLQILPAVLFLTAILISFSTGTSWGTFFILIPLVVSIFNDQVSPIMVLTISAVLGGSVCGDHLSPVSDTTIMSSIGSGCKLINHVSSQMPYGILAGVCSVVGYIVGSLSQSSSAGFLAGALVLILFVVIYKTREKRQNAVIS